MKQRPLEFRAWIFVKKQFVENFSWDLDTGAIYSDLPSDGVCHWSYEKEEYIIQQYTGALDKNNKKIFEGDIVKGRFYITYDDGRPVVIEYMQLDNCGDCTWDSGMGFNFYLAEPNEAEVIGNIFENPELIPS